LQQRLKIAAQRSADINDAVRTRLELKTAIQQKIDLMDELGGQLHQSAARFAERIARAIRERLTPASQAGGPSDRAVEFYLADLAETQKTSVDLRLNIAFLTNYGHKVLLMSDKERIAAIRSEKIAPIAENIQSGIERLKVRVSESDEMPELLATIETTFGRLRSLLLDSETGLARLQSLWLAEEAAIAEKNALLTQTTDALMAGLDDLQTLPDRVCNRAEYEARRAQDV